jgi:hypothetical protein
MRRKMGICKCMLNVYKNQQNRQTGSRNLMGPKTLPTIWAFLNLSDSYFLFADLVGFYTHWTYMHIFLSNYWWQKSDIWSQASYRYPYRGKRFWTHQIPTSCLPILLIFIHIEHICTFFVAFFSATVVDRNLIFGHKLHIGMPYCGKRFWTCQIPTSCLPT